MKKVCIPWFQPKRIQKINRIALYICIPVQACTTVNASKNNILIDKAFDIDKIVDEDTVPFFAPLKLVQYSGDGKYDIKRSVVKDIPSEIVYYCILSDNEEHLQNNHQISIDTLLEGVGQIGRYMCLSYSTLLELLQQLENAGKLTLVNNFGNRYIQLNTIDTDAVLAHYYQGITR